MKNKPSTPSRLLRQASLLLFGLVPFLTSSCTNQEFWQDFNDKLPTEKHQSDIPETITFTNSGLYPEGVAHDERNSRFLVTSLRQGTIGAVSYSGAYTPFVQDSRVISAIGLKVDDPQQRILVAVSDPGASPASTPQTAGQLAALGIYNLNTGRAEHFVNLGALRPGQRHFANDITLDPRGNAYVTDSFSPIIYKVDTRGNASVFFEDAAFATAPGEFGFNGIAYHPDGYLLVAFSKENKIYKLPIRNPDALEEVALNAPLMGPDGLLLSKDGRQLVVVNNAGGQAPGKVVSFTSNDAWQTGTQTESFTTDPVFPTTATAYNQEVYVLYAYLNRLFGGVQPPVSEFTIRRVPFSKNRNF